MVEERQVKEEEAIKRAREHEMEYFETSAKENLNIDKMMHHIFEKTYESVFPNSQ